MPALRPIYTAVNVEAAAEALDLFELEHGDRYPGIVTLWRHAWEQFIPFLAYPAVIRKIVYTTDDIVNPSRQVVGLPVGDHHLIGPLGMLDERRLLIS